MKTFKELKKGDQLFTVMTGDNIKGHIDIVSNTVLTDYAPIDTFSFQMSGVQLNTKDGIMIVPFNSDDTSSGMTFTELDEAKKTAYTMSEQIVNGMNAEMNKKLNEAFTIHDNIVVLNMKRSTWNVTKEKQ